MNGRLSDASGALADEYQTVVIGSGYGGAITAARLAEQGISVCMLERGKEWKVGEFPDRFTELAGNLRSKSKPLGLIDLYLCSDLDVIKGNGLGGTSLVNLNVAFRPDRELFADKRWPKAYRDLADSGEIWPFYERAEKMLRVGPHPRASELTKIKRLKQRADQVQDKEFGPVNISVNFDIDGPNHVGVQQKPCIDCGDCFPGCNVGAKGTLMMNYLPFARQKGVKIFTQVEVRYVEKEAQGFKVHYRFNQADCHGELRWLRASNVILAAGAVGSTEILLRSKKNGLATSAQVGQRFSGNGDFIGLAYNSDYRCDVVGFGNRPDSPRSKVAPGPTIVSAIQYDRSGPFDERVTVEDFTLLPSALVDFFRRTIPGLALTGQDTDRGWGDETAEAKRIATDFIHWSPKGALNHSMIYLAMAVDDSRGNLLLNDRDKLDIKWPSVKKDPIFDRIGEELLQHAKTLGGTYVQLARPSLWPGKKSNLFTAHPLGGCALGEDADSGVVDQAGRVFDGKGGVHKGLYVIDGSIVPMAVAVNPFLTISALAERISTILTASLS